MFKHKQFLFYFSPRCIILNAAVREKPLFLQANMLQRTLKSNYTRESYSSRVIEWIRPVMQRPAPHSDRTEEVRERHPALLCINPGYIT